MVRRTGTTTTSPLQRVQLASALASLASDHAPSARFLFLYTNTLKRRPRLLNLRQLSSTLPMSVFDDGTVGILYEADLDANNTGYKILFSRLSVSQITGGAYEAMPAK